MRILKILVIFQIIFFICNCNCEESIVENKVKLKLKAGIDKGTFHFIYSGTAKSIDDAKIPIRIVIRDTEDMSKVYAHIDTHTDKKFKLEANLRPGKLSLESKILDVQFKKKYLNCPGTVVTLTKDGTAEYSEVDFIHLFRLIIEKPKFLEKIDLSNQKQPKIKWIPLEKADHYEIFWKELQEDGTEIKSKTLKEFKNFELLLDLKSEGNNLKNKTYSILFTITAYSKNNKPIGSASSTFYVQY